MRSVPRLAALLGLGLALAAPATQASVVVSRQVLPFTTGSVEYIEYGPTFAPPFPTYQQTKTLQFNGFDASLGTLLDAYVSIEDTYAIEYAVISGIVPLCETRTVAVGAIALYEYDFGLAVTGATGPLRKTVHTEKYSTILSGYASSSMYCAGMWIGMMDGSGPKVYDGSIDGKFSGNPWVSGGNLDLPLLSLADGLDVDGATVDVTLNKDFEQFLLPIFSASVWPTYSRLDNFLNEWKGSLALTYVYETDLPAPMPEPATLALASGGLAALAAFAALRRRSAAPGSARV